MTQFKIGDKVRQKSTGDQGIINELHNSIWEETCWYVLWTSGADKGKRLHISENNIELVQTSEQSEPCTLTVKTYKGNTKCHEVEILGPSKVVYSPDKPLSCGAKVWIETQSAVVCKS